MSEAPDAVVVEHDTTARQFGVGSGDQRAVLQYRRDPRAITFLHTEVPEAFRGQGIAQKLAQTGLEFARSEGLNVIPLCPFVNAYIKRHPEYQSLVKSW
jgi:predicted GNAT family acetyltransferase